MTDDPKSGTPGADDPIKQVKGEFNRKIDATTKQIEELKALTQQLLTKVAPPKQTTPPTDPEAELEDLMYSSPKEYARRIKQQAKDEIKQEFSAIDQVRSKASTMLQSLASEYPELNDASSAFYKKANEIYMSLDDEDRKSPLAYKAAVTQAAQELEMKPKSKRNTEDDEDFVGGGSGYAPRNRKKKSGLNEVTKYWAEQMGINVDDPEVAKRLEERAQRPWGRYREPLPVKGKKR